MMMPTGHTLLLPFPLVPFAALGGSFYGDAKRAQAFLVFPSGAICSLRGLLLW